MTILVVALSARVGAVRSLCPLVFCSVEEQPSSSASPLYKKGYYAEGSGDPASYALENYDEIKHMLLEDAVIGPRLELVTAHIVVTGIVNSPATGASSTFYGVGVFPSEDFRLSRWNPYGIYPPWELPINTSLREGPPELANDDPAGGSIGPGLARVLKLDRAPATAKTTPASAPPQPADDEADIGFLTEQASATPAPAPPNRPLICWSRRRAVACLMSYNAGAQIMPLATKELDDMLISCRFSSFELLFPNQPLRFTAVIALLKRTEDTDLVARRLDELFA